MQPVRWGVLGVAKIATKKVIPAMQQSAMTPVMAIASRDLAKAQAAAAELGIAKAYGSYEDLLADPEIDAIYNPLPNHLHVPWSAKAAEAGKHVLCEKPLGLGVAEVRELIAVRDRTGVKMGEAFMVHTHPQWLRVKQILREGLLGDLRVITGFFSYYNDDPANIRNVVDWGGGGIMDIGCYPIHVSRFLLDAEPDQVLGIIDRDPLLKTDRVASAMLRYGSVQVTFTCSTQLVPYQKVHIFGTKGRIEVEIPFNAPPDRPCRVFVDIGGDLFGSTVQTETFPVCDQYTLQGEEFSRAIRQGGEVPVPLENSLGNMAVIEQLLAQG
ncbi:MAG: Gfo/Idh/MocA family oxidoreductase [Bryobacterales bacterium]|nr:Gfo/Idh/MocA family oxidoreductase [Bryobacterales bacterium]